MKNILIVFLLVSSMLVLVVQPTTAKEKEKDFISLAYVSFEYAQDAGIRSQRFVGSV